MPTLSVVMANFNEAQNLRGVLQSVKFADEVVVVDGGSTDDSVSVARSFCAKVFCRNAPREINANTNIGFDNASGDWILLLNTDERVPVSLRIEIRNAINTSAYEGYFIKFRNFLGGKWLAHGGWYPDKHLRLFRNRKSVRFPCLQVHEGFKVGGKIGTLTHPIDHFSYRNFAEYWRKFMLYTHLEASMFPQFNKRKCPPVRFLAIEPIRIFLDKFVRQEGYLDGGEGLIVNFFSALYPAVSYLRYRVRV